MTNNDYNTEFNNTTVIEGGENDELRSSSSNKIIHQVEAQQGLYILSISFLI